jgi:type IV secretion/conjugal transfer VirB4 family ATPase
MWNLREFNPVITKLSDLLCWAALIAPGTLLNKDGSFQKTFCYRGQDLDNSTQNELITIAARMNNVLRRLGSNWAIYSEAQRIRSIEYPTSAFPDPISAVIDLERKKYFQKGHHYESVYYFTLVFLPPLEKSDKMEKMLIQKEEQEAVEEEERYQNHLRTFLAETRRVFDLLSDVMPECHELDNDETLTYLHSCCSPEQHDIKTPEIPMYLDGIVVDTPLIGGLEPRLGEHHISAISILGFPSMTNPGLLDALNRLGFEYRWVTRFIAMDKLDATNELETYRRIWLSKRKSMATLIKETLSSTESPIEDGDAMNKFHDADEALQEVADDAVSYGFMTTTIILLEKNKKQLDKNSRIVEKTINGKGFATIAETMNCVDAWLGSLPGMCRANVRRPILSTMNLSHLMPISSVWAGQMYNKHLEAPVLLHTQTNGSTPFRVSLHVGDVGHTMIVGPTGSGKSVLMNTLEVQFRRYKNAQVYIFDKGGSCRALTAGVGGEFYDLASEGNGLSFQPLAHIDDENERMWAQEWLLKFFAQENLEITPDLKKEVWEALGKLSTSPEDERTLFGFQLVLQNSALQDAIEAITVNGAYGKLFDSDKDTLSYGKWQVFEMEELMSKKGAVLPALDYIFHKLEKNCTGAPTIFMLDECWTFLDNPIFAAKIREWLKVMRKNNVSIIFATQNLQDVAESSIAPAIMESCPTKIFLPNPSAMDERLKELYYSFGLNDSEREIIATATPKRQYYYKSVLGCRLFDLALDQLALAYVASAKKEDQEKVKDLLERYGKEGFNEKWLEYKKIPKHIELLKTVQEKETKEGGVVQ